MKQDQVKAYLFLKNSAGKNPLNKAELEDLAAHLSTKDRQKLQDPYQQRWDAKSVTCR